MQRDIPNAVNRRRVLRILGASAALAAIGAPASACGDDNEDENGDLSSLDPAPKGEPLTEEDRDALLKVFDDEPTNEDQREIEGERRDYTPSHVWKWVSDETLIALHFDDPNPEEADYLNYAVVGVKGAFTEEDQPGPEFTHFHRHTADSWEAGHGGEPGDEGYWLTHVNVRELELPFHDEPTAPGVDYEFMPTPPEEGSEGTAEFESPEGQEGDLTEEDRDALLEVFDDEPTNEDQREIEGERRDYTPSHVWKWVSEDVLLFLHFDEPNPEEAENLIYFGIGQRGQFTAEDRPEGPPENDDEVDFTHFHKWEADGWEAGHGAQSEDQYGYWLVHHAVRPLEMPWGDVDVGVDREFMPTPIEEAEGEVVDATDEETVEIATREGEGDEPEFVFDPDRVVVDEGTTVRWVNTDGVFHTVTATDSLENRTPSEEFDAAISSEGDSFEWVAEEAGTQHYYCQPHAEFMYGTIEIE